MNIPLAKKTIATSRLTVRMEAVDLKPETMDDSRPAGRSVVRAVLIEDLDANPFQPRIEVDEERLDELTASLREHGQLQPIVVAESGGGRRVIVCGERRVQAAKRLGWREVEARVYPGVTEHELRLLALVENIQRENLSPFEVAAGFTGFLIAGGSIDELVRLTGFREVTVRRYLRITELSPDVLAAAKTADLGFKKLYGLAASGLAPAEQLNLIRIWSTGASVSAAEARRTVFRTKPASRKSPTRTEAGPPTEIEAGHLGGKTTWFTSAETEEGKPIPLTVVVRTRRKGLPAAAFRMGLARVIQQSYGEEMDLVAALRRAAEEIEAAGHG